MRAILEKYARFTAFTHLVSILGLAICSIWYGAWFPDAQSRLLERMKTDIPETVKPSFWEVSYHDKGISSPVPYTVIFLFLTLVGSGGIVVNTFRLEDLQGKEAEFKKEQENHSETQQYYYESLRDHLVQFFCHQVANFDDTCRASVYRHDPSAQLFRMVFRYSKITSYEAKGRVSLPEKEGVVGAT